METASHLHARTGNALLMGLVVTVLVGSMILSSTSSYAVRQTATVSGVNQSVAVAALEAVLTRRQQAVIDLAASGDPGAFTSYTTNFGADIIGACEVRWKIEPVVTPYKSPDGAAIPFIANPSPDQSWTPPSGLQTAKNNDLNWQTNDYVYLFRVSAESRVVPEVDKNADEDVKHALKPLARAQGVRYVSINNQPLFRWVIFYAAEGPKGDLELSHGTDLSVLGNVHSNGSVYLGSSPTSNSWLALKPTLGSTKIGPDSSTWTSWASGTNYKISDRIQYGSTKYKCTAAHTAGSTTQPGSGTQWQAYWEAVDPARVTGVDGVFRLSKQTMFGAFNGFPMGTAPSGFSVTGDCYSLSSTPAVGETASGSNTTKHYPTPDTSSVLSAIFGGTIINPNRVRDASGLQTSVMSGTDDRVLINGNPIRGVVDGTLPANDSRDVDRSSVNKWTMTYTQSAPTGFESMVRQSQTGGRYVRLPRILESRPMEAQKLEYPTNSWTVGSSYIATFPAPTADGTNSNYDKNAINVVSNRGYWYVCKASHTAAATNEPGVGPGWTTYWTLLPGEPHEYARPVFLQSDRTESTRMLTSGAYAGIEVPGQYLRYALGSSSLYLKRRLGATLNEFTGWDVVDNTGAVSTSQPGSVGLLIRERPVPDSTYYTTASIVPLSSNDALPFAYGKHTRPTLWPFTASDVSSELWEVQNGSNNSNYMRTNSSGQTYTLSGGYIPVIYDGTNYINRAYTHINEAASSQSYAVGGSVELRAANNPGANYPNGIADTNAGITRYPHYYSDNWRFTQLGQSKIDTSSNGLLATYWSDCSYNTLTAALAWRGPFRGFPAGTRLETSPNVSSTTALPGVAGIGTTGFSVRYEGFVVPTVSASYQFVLTHTYGARMWVDGQRVVDRWMSTAGSFTSYSTAISLTAGQQYPIVIEWFTPYTGGSVSRSFNLAWRSTDLTTVPQATVPNGVLYPRLNDTTTRTAQSLDWSTFSAAQVRLDKVTGNALQKVGLMLRPGVGFPLLRDGRGAYATIAYSPTRGIFLQERGQASEAGQATGATKFVGSATWATGTTSSSGEMTSEDRNNNGVLDTGEDSDSDGALRDPATVTRKAKLLPFGPNLGQPTAITTNTWVTTDYMPSTSGVSVWGGTGSGSTDPRYTNLTVISNPPFAIAEGTVDKVYVGPLALSTRKRPTGNKYQSASVTWYWSLDPATLDDAYNQLFIYNSTPTVNDRGKSLRFYERDIAGTADAGQTSYTAPGSLTTTTLQSGGNNFVTPTAGTYTSLYGIRFYGNPTSTVTGGYAPYTSTGFYQSWTNTSYGTTIYGTESTVGPTTVATNKTIFYLSGTPDTRPKVYQGSTFVRYLTSAETLALMNATYGSGHSVVTSLPSYPTLSDPTALTASALPDPTTPTQPIGYQDVQATRAAVASTTAATTIALLDAFQIRVGESYTIDREVVTATAVSAPSTNAANHTVTVDRAKLGTSAAAHVSGSILINPCSAQLGVACTATATTITIANLAAGAANIIEGDILRVPNAAALYPLPIPPTAPTTYTAQPAFELMRVQSVAGTTLTVERGVLTAAVSHPSGVPLIRVVPRTFRLDRARYYSFDLNSFTSLAGNVTAGSGAAATGDNSQNIGWFYNRTPQYLPWYAALWGALSPPNTGGFRPDQWYWTTTQTAPPSAGSTQKSLLPTIPTTGRSTASSGTTVGQVLNSASSPQTIRWSDDTPGTVPQVPPFGTAAVWLRLEKVGTSQLRFLYRIGDTGGFTALTRSDGSTATLDVSRWFAARKSTITNTPGTGTTIAVADISPFAYGDLVRVGNEIMRISAVSATSGAGNLTVVRAQLGTTNTSITTSGADIVLLSGDYAGGDMQLGLAVQGGPRYWTTATSAIGGATMGTSSVISVASTTGMVVGDIIQCEYELMQIQSINSSTSITVLRGYDYTRLPTSTTTASHSVGAGISSVSNPVANATTAAVSNIEITTTASGDAATIDHSDWEAAAGGASQFSKYLASQYQVLWGTYDITEAFFSHSQDSPSGRLATEEWIYNPREFWSQSRWWDEDRTREKDPDGNSNSTTHDDTTNRVFLGKTTMLTLNMRALQDYLKATLLQDAVAKPITGGVVPTVPAANNVYLSAAFNGLFYVARTNRYPWQPIPGQMNPFNYQLPNGMTSATDTASLALTPEDNYRSLEQFTSTFNYLRGQLQPYSLNLAPAFRPQDFIHGVRVVNGAEINWGLPSSGTAEFGASKTSVCTPNQLFVQGDFNTTAHTVNYNGGTPPKLTPCALMADMVTFLSNAWSDANFKQAGLELNSATGYTVASGGTLAYNQVASCPLPQATSTSYFASILTHNQPTTRQTVRYGECSAFINTMEYLEDWVGQDMSFLGSLVVMDSRRYTRSYLLESGKQYGLTPFGFISNNTSWLSEYGISAVNWTGQIGAVQGPPNRKMDFNYDLLTEQGTPPFTPFGVTASGVGSWTRVVE